MINSMTIDTEVAFQARNSLRKQKGSRVTQNKDKHKFSMKILIKLKIYKIILWN